MHLASPFFMDMSDETMIPQAVSGTMAAMKACKTHGIKRCVITSSFVAVFAVAEADRPADGVFNESNFSNPDRPEGMNNYFKSKTLAEKIAWDF